MKTLRFIHTADWHADSDLIKQEKLADSLDQILQYVKDNKVNALIHAGDIWERKQNYANNSGVPMVINYLKEISKYVDFIFITKGNNSHDEPGSVSLLQQIEPNIYAYEYPVCLGVWINHTHNSKSIVFDLLREHAYDNPDFIVSLVPYPQKSGFITYTSIDNNNSDFLEKFEQIFELIGDVTAEYNCPKILGFHGNVVGSRLSSGQSLVSQDLMVAPSTLEKAKADYYALGHIHLRQEIKPWMLYSGSIYNKSWGETEQKSFEVIEFKNWQMNFGELEGEKRTEQILLSSAKPMITVNLHFTKGKFEFDAGEDEENTGIQFAQFRVRVDVKENERNLITDESIGYLKTVYGNDAKIEITTLPIERESRSEIIMSCKTLLDEVEEYAKVTNSFELLVNGKVADKVISLQEEVSL